jgi:predicted ribosome quality control (RQC) complex YloA/Tae2 family protein
MDPIEGQTPDAQQQGAASKTFSQEEVDRLIGERLKRERDKYADYDDAKKAKAELESIKASQMSEAEKVAAAIKDRDTRLAELEEKAQAAEKRAQEYVRQAKIVSAASQLGAYDPADPNFAAATAAIDPSDPKADEQVKAAIEALKASKPYLFKAPGARGLEAFNPAGNTGQAETDAQRVARVINKGGGRSFGPIG